jgi:GntR family transcriptional regulator
MTSTIVMQLQKTIQSLTAKPGAIYARIRDELRAQIIAGIYQPHDRLPSESDLMKRYGVSRITVRNAVSELEKEGVLFKLAGKGVYVSKPKPFQSLIRLQGLAEAMAQHGHEIFNDVLSITTVPANEEIALRLGLSLHADVTELRRIRYLNRTPISLDVTYVSPALGERLAHEDLATRDIFLILENDFDIALGFADLTIDAICADAQLASALKIDDGDPVLRVCRLTHDASGAPIDFEYLYCRSDNFQFRLRIER